MGWVKLAPLSSPDNHELFSLKEQYASTPLYCGNANAVEALYQQFLEDSAAVPAAWRDYFETLGLPAAGRLNGGYENLTAVDGGYSQ